MSWTGRIFSAIRTNLPQITQVRFRYFKEMRENGPLVRRHGIRDPLNMRGLLPRESEERIKEMPLFRPKDTWNEKRALFGQNDYIDILGDDNLHPTRILYNVPSWLRGVQGKEFQVLLRKEKMWAKGIIPVARPKRWRDIKKRIKFLYNHLNRETRTGLQRRH